MRIIESKYNYRAYFLLLAFPLYGILIYVHFNTARDLNSMLTYIFPSIMLISLYGVFSELRTKAITVKIDNVFRVKRFLGQGEETTYRMKDLDGYQTTRMGAYNKYDGIIILHKGKKVAKISGQYHSNLDEIEEHLQNNIPNLGSVNSNVFSEIQDSFTY